MSVDALWLMICVIALMFMQLGFCQLEMGYARSKNTINVVIKNTLDLAITLLAYVFIGYSIATGTSYLGLIGIPNTGLIPDILTSLSSPEDIIRILISSLFCATAVTIISGAAAERITFSAYLLCSVFMAAVIFPIISHWIWNDGTGTGQPGWLNRLGFQDFSGATVVHSVGGWAALAAVICLGPRAGRFSSDKSQKNDPIRPGNIPQIACGTLILWMAWIGFNGVGYFAFNDKIPLIIFNTFLSGSAALMTGVVFSYFKTGKVNALVMMNCGLGGLVISTGACHMMSPAAAVILGIVAAMTVIGCDAILKYYEIDDVVGAIPVHLGCGIMGTLSVVLFVDYRKVQVHEQLLVQAAGILSTGFLVFGSTWLLFKVADRCMSTRVSREDEEIGLNVAIHDAYTPMLDVLVQMSKHAVHNNEFHEPIPVSSQEEAGHIATFYNALLKKTDKLQNQNQQLSHKIFVQKDRDPLTQSLTRKSWLEKLILALHEAARGDLVTVILVDIKGFRLINQEHGEGIADALLQHVHKAMQSYTPVEGYTGRLEGDRFAMLLSDTSLLQAETIAERLTNTINDEPFFYSDRKIPVAVRFSIASPQNGEDEQALLRRLIENLDSP